MLFFVVLFFIQKIILIFNYASTIFKLTSTSKFDLIDKVFYFRKMDILDFLCIKGELFHTLDWLYL